MLLGFKLFWSGVILILLVSGEAAAAQSVRPATVAFVGDSMADGLWGAMFRRLGKEKCIAERIKLIRNVKNGTGLTRLDQFNWIDQVGAVAAQSGVDVFVGSFGVNDRQPIVDAAKARTEYGTPEFDVHYQSNIVDLVRAGMSHGGSVLIMGLPIMLNPAAAADAAIKNKLFAAAVAQVNSPRAVYVAPWTSRPGVEEYKPYLPDANSVMTLVRAPDGVHFTTTGYDRVMDAFYPAIMASFRQRGRDIEAECAGQIGSR
jgi:uncharacterized protein